ncbi:Spo0E like sporulation regulatory protein [Paenibacillus sp. UNCCL117]|uniref:aspartyl-phosphate phosphatase Spo0E family protein n=1 Tax=unclassified Paenibacillus TaxID=185978 RepID=UPI00088A041A|nr:MULTISPECIES: aspartyl-phosphate phosphatase Spo0E family protein [unclassified Paenibacillus]SDE03754.1 Spo0E like sporulation regulatory protein [Paenibacillus sp. cl123]SFW57476.1 Spo0E like sporulation regulatory protein [Paenibacillus sp. UNCCL117]
MTDNLADLHITLTLEIEHTRERMVRLGVELGLMHPEVHRCSEQLDLLLLRFYYIDKQRKSRSCQFP